MVNTIYRMRSNIKTKWKIAPKNRNKRNSHYFPTPSYSIELILCFLSAHCVLFFSRPEQLIISEHSHPMYISTAFTILHTVPLRYYERFATKTCSLLKHSSYYKTQRTRTDSEFCIIKVCSPLFVWPDIATLHTTSSM